MIANTGATIDHFIEEWTREIAAYAERYSDNMIARRILDTRYVGADVGIDVVTTYDKTGPGANVTAKGAVPKSISTSSTDTKHDIYQIAVAFNISQKDLNLDPERYNRTIDIALKEIHRKEDDITINGVTNLDLDGLIAAAQANSNGKIVDAGAAGSDTNNKGAWAGEADTDIYDDILTASGKIDDEFGLDFLVGRKADLAYLYRLDSERNTYEGLSTPLFNTGDWMAMTNRITAGKVYATTKDFTAGELVISENPSIVPLYNGGLGPGRNYYFEIAEWIVPEFHNNDGFVEINIL